jgi:hypothetical protein
MAGYVDFPGVVDPHIGVVGQPGADVGVGRIQGAEMLVEQGIGVCG